MTTILILLHSIYVSSSVVIFQTSQLPNVYHTIIAIFTRETSPTISASMTYGHFLTFPNCGSYTSIVDVQKNNQIAEKIFAMFNVFILNPLIFLHHIYH